MRKIFVHVTLTAILPILTLLTIFNLDPRPLVSSKLEKSGAAINMSLQRDSSYKNIENIADKSSEFAGLEITLDKFNLISPLPDNYPVPDGFDGLAITLRLSCTKPEGCQVSIFDISVVYPIKAVYAGGYTTDVTYAEIVYGSQVDFPETVAQGETALASATYVIQPCASYKILYSNYHDKQVAEIDNLYNLYTESDLSNLPK